MRCIHRRGTGRANSCIPSQADRRNHGRGRTAMRMYPLVELLGGAANRTLWVAECRSDAQLRSRSCQRRLAAARRRIPREIARTRPLRVAPEGSPNHRHICPPIEAVRSEVLRAWRNQGNARSLGVRARKSLRVRVPPPARLHSMFAQVRRYSVSTCRLAWAPWAHFGHTIAVQPGRYGVQVVIE